ncbi:MAG: hypothetical protein L6301_00855 [Desulfobacteraceae bacterium]|nr:hypothetical protein [Desulfobacteraceae bacterium]
MKQPVFTMSEFIEAANKQNGELKRQCYLSDGAIVLNVGAEYFVELKRANTKAKILNWVHHLSGKNWMTTELLRRFIELACQANRLKPWGEI